MKNYMHIIKQAIRSIIFMILFYLWSIIIFISILLLSWKKYEKIKNIPVIWSNVIMYLLRVIVGIKYRVNGIDNIPKNKPFIIVSAHQSAWDTWGLCAIIKQPIVFILKRELMLIPLFNICLKIYGCIPIKRGDKNMINNIISTSKQELNKSKVIGIFPQGSRKKPEDKIKCKSGIWYLYQYFKDIDFIPVSLDSGKFWAKGQLIKSDGLITVTVHKKLNLSREINKHEFLDKLENILSDQINY